MTGYDNLTFIYDSQNRLVKQSNNMEFLYDSQGVAGMKYNNICYLYRKDAQGNVREILDTVGNVVVEYKYDAWGNRAVLDSTGANVTSANHIGNINPFCYRGYYFDTETELYYLKSRYYDPEVGRFITIDDISFLAPNIINGLNLYAYCGNNPVMSIDSNGTMPNWLKWTLGIVIILGSLALSIVTGGLAAPIAGAIGGIWGAIVGGAIAGAIGGAIAGFGFSVGMQGILNGFDQINWKQVWKDTGVGAISGFISGGVFAGIKHAVNIKKVLNKISGLKSAYVDMQKATLMLKNTDSFAGVFKGGSMAVREIAQRSYDFASCMLNHALTVYKGLNLLYSGLYYGAKFGFKQLIGYGLKAVWN